MATGNGNPPRRELSPVACTNRSPKVNEQRRRKVLNGIYRVVRMADWRGALHASSMLPACRSSRSSNFIEFAVERVAFHVQLFRRPSSSSPSLSLYLSRVHIGSSTSTRRSSPNDGRLYPSALYTAISKPRPPLSPLSSYSSLKPCLPSSPACELLHERLKTKAHTKDPSYVLPEAKSQCFTFAFIRIFNFSLKTKTALLLFPITALSP